MGDDLADGLIEYKGSERGTCQACTVCLIGVRVHRLGARVESRTIAASQFRVSTA